MPPSSRVHEKSLDPRGTCRAVALYWNPWALVGIASWIIGWGLAALVYASRPRHLQNRFLALYLVLLASGFGVGVGWMFAAADAATSLGLQAVSLAAYYASGPVYVLFLSTLQTRTMAWARPTWVRVSLGVWALAAAFGSVAYFDALVGGVIEVPYAKQDSYWTPLGTRVFEAQAILTATLGVVAAVGAWWEAPRNSATRVQAGWYMAAFVTWEVAQLSAFVLIEIAFGQASPDVRLYTAAAGVILPAATLILMLMLGYGILKYQLFSIDLRLKRGLSRSIVIAPFAVVFFVTTETLESVLPFESYLAGLAAAGVLSLFGIPLQRGANRLADRLFPHVRDDARYRAARGEEIYRAALEGAWEDGVRSAVEVAILRRLQEQLGLADRDARRLEAEVEFRHALPNPSLPVLRE